MIDYPVLYWLNDFLDNRCDGSQVLIDISKGFDIKGKLFVGLSDSSIEAIRITIDKSRDAEITTIKKLFSLLSILRDKNIDYCIIDTSPGVQYSSVNALAASNLCFIVTSRELKGWSIVLYNEFSCFISHAFVLEASYSPCYLQIQVAEIVPLTETFFNPCFRFNLRFLHVYHPLFNCYQLLFAQCSNVQCMLTLRDKSSSSCLI